MYHFIRSRYTLFLLLLVILLLVSLTVAYADPTGRQRTSNSRVTVTGVDFLGEVAFETGTIVDDTEMGGLSAITYDHSRRVYYALSDDPSERDSARFYTLRIDVSDGSLDEGDIEFLRATTLLDHNGQPFEPFTIDPEGMILGRPGFNFISSEGFVNADPPIDPFVNRYNPIGKETRKLPVPGKFLPDGSGEVGVRHNLAFESLTATPDRRYLFTATENALAQDGPVSDIDQESLSRILQYHMRQLRPMDEYVYVDNPVAEEPVPPEAFRVNGLVELLALDNGGTFLAMERSFSVGGVNTVWLYEIRTDDATDVSGYETLFPDGPGNPPVDFEPVSKDLLLTFNDLVDEDGQPLTIDNLEGLALAPALPDGRVPLIVVSDNNFLPFQETQFIALGLTLEWEQN